MSYLQQLVMTFLSVMYVTEVNVGLFSSAVEVTFRSGDRSHSWSSCWL